MFRLRDAALVVTGALVTFLLGSGLLFAWQDEWSDPRDLPLTAPPVVVGHILSLSGGLMRAHGKAWSPAMSGDALLLGTSLRTEENAEAWLVLADGSQLRLSAESELTLVADGARLARGAVRAWSSHGATHVHGEDGSDVEVTAGPIDVMARTVSPGGGADALSAISMCGEATLVGVDGHTEPVSTRAPPKKSR